MVSALLGVYFFSRIFSITEFGFWSWLLSISVMVTSQDFGILSAMRVWLGKEYASDEDFKQKHIFVAGLMGVFVVLVIVVLGLVAYLIRASSLESALLLCWVVLASVFSIFGTVAANALLAFLSAGSVGLIELLRSIAQIALILLAYHLDWGLDLTVGVYYLPFVLYVPVVMGFLCFVHKWRLPAILRQGLKNFSTVLSMLWVLVKNGILLWVNQLAYVAILSADVFLGGIFLTEPDVATVAVINKLVGLGLGVVGAGLLPYFGLYVHKLAGQDSSWVRHELRKAVLSIGFVSVGYVLMLLIFGQPAVLAWTGFEIGSRILYVFAGLEFGVLSLLTYLQLYFQGPRLSLEILPFVLCASILRLVVLWLGVEGFGVLMIFVSSVLANGVLVLLLLRKLMRSIKDNKEMVLMW